MLLRSRQRPDIRQKVWRKCFGSITCPTTVSWRQMRRRRWRGIAVKPGPSLGCLTSWIRDQNARVLSVVMESTLRDFQELIGGFPGNAIHQAVGECNSSRPPPLEITAQGFRFSCAGKGRARTLFDQIVHAGQGLGMTLPVQIIFPCLGGKNQFHGWTSSRSFPLPASKAAMAAANRSALAFCDRRGVVSSVAFQSAKDTITTASPFLREITTGVRSRTTWSITDFSLALVSEKLITSMVVACCTCSCTYKPDTFRFQVASAGPVAGALRTR